MTESEYIQVFNTYRMYIFYFCRKLINHKEDAEEITANVFVSLWRYKEKVNINSAKAFLLVTANHKCQDYFKMERRRRDADEAFSFAEIEEVEIQSDVLGYLYNLISTLQPQEKRMVMLKYKDGKEVKEIAKLLQLSPQTVSNTLNNGLKKIRSLVNKKAH